MGLFDKWNKNKFSIYKSEEKTVLKLIENINNFVGKLAKGIDDSTDELTKRINNKTDELTKRINNKTDLYGDHKGSWQGLNRPTLSEEGMRATVEQLADETIPNIETHLADIAINVKGHTSENQIGTTRNEAEQTYVYPTRIVNPVLPDAPTVKNIPNKGIDLIAHWYNDFGLEKTAASPSQANGSYIWYDWRWNHTTNPNYDPSRHPLLGWYAGDDPKTLDWICYWLAEAGVNVVCPVGYVPSTDAWNEPSDEAYWQYVLFNQVKNFRSLKYIPWLKYNGTQEDCNKQHNDVINNIVLKYKNIYIYNCNGKKYATFFVWSSEQMRGVYDNYNGSSRTQAHYESLATTLKGLGFDGICLLLRQFKGADGTVWKQSQLDSMKANGVIMLQAGYEMRYGSNESYSNLYSNYVNNVVFPTTQDTVINVVTSAKTQEPHPSGWNLAGSTPDLFRQVLQKAVVHVATHNLPKMITIYNVSEWAEGGAGLIPNKRDGFGYLDAIRAVNLNSKENLNIDMIKTDVKDFVLTSSKEWTILKKNNVTLNGRTGATKTVIDMGYLNNYNYQDNKDNYAFFTTLDFPDSNIDYQCSVYTNVSFSASRIYVTVINNSGDDITDVGVSVMIRKVT